MANLHRNQRAAEALPLPNQRHVFTANGICAVVPKHTNAINKALNVMHSRPRRVGAHARQLSPACDNLGLQLSRHCLRACIT